MKKIKNIIVLYPSFERGGATENLINFVNDCDKKKIKIYLITNIDKKNQINLNLFFITSIYKINQVCSSSTSFKRWI